MLRFMERSTIHLLNHKGWSNSQIADFLGHHRDTVAKVLREPLDQQPARRQRISTVAPFDAQIQDWLDQKLTTQRMLELAQADPDHPYLGSTTAFYDYVRPRRRARRTTPAAVAVRFEGLPGEFLQIDWGELRDFPFSHPAVTNQTRYFFAARLKYSRWMWVRFTSDMREETLLRCLIACFCALDGVPWVVTSDNMKTITLGRDDHNQPLWHPTYLKLATEFAFHPMVCAPAAGNQKGAVENLVKFVKSNFVAGRTFYDDADLADECAAWLERVNTLRPSNATEQVPAALLAEEHARFGPLPVAAEDYGLFDSVLVNRESLVALATNRYSVPIHLVGSALTARIFATRIELFHGAELVASHARCRGRNQRCIVPEHYEALFALKPRARIMLYRDWLVALAPVVADYLSQLCRKRYAELDTQIPQLYALAQQVGSAAFVAAVAQAAAQDVVGVEYVQALATTSRPHAPPLLEQQAGMARSLGLLQRAVERDLAHYEQYVSNRTAIGVAEEGGLQ